uniref:Uncharacterized protein n=1 Tax=Cajanus cajan TaxID=3821 RepID=A0A151QTI4_CAJCA|nr:hypothetical protein KK1_045505 [Cajanus cajan]
MYQGVQDKVSQRLSSWKVKKPSLVRILALTKSIISALPTYVMHTTFLPRDLCDMLEKKCRGILWEILS